MAKKTLFKQTANVSANSVTTLLEVNKPSKFIHGPLREEKQHLSLGEWGKWFLLAGLMMVLLITGIMIAVSWWYVSEFEKVSGIGIEEIVQAYREAGELDTSMYQDGLTILILGLDQSEKNQRTASLLTDTIILASYDSETHTFVFRSLPRDLWIDSLKTKINALYFYGQQSGDDGGITLLRSVLSEVTGLTIDHHLIVTMDTLSQIVDALGGIEVDVIRGFEDRLYPREIDLTSKDPAILYETIVFNPGPELMDGDRALKYVRSRYSQDELEGTDEGRELRQQRLLMAIKTKLMRPETITNPRVMGALYQARNEALVSDIDDVTVMRLLRFIGFNSPAFVSKTLPIQTASGSGIIYHPDRGPANQWVYLPVDSSWKELRQWFSQ